MQYEKPIMEVIVLETEDVIRTSFTGEGAGDGGSGTGPWGGTN